MNGRVDWQSMRRPLRKVDGESLLFTPMVFTVTNPAYLKLPYGKRPDSGPITVLACGRAAQCTAQE